MSFISVMSQHGQYKCVVIFRAFIVMLKHNVDIIYHPNFVGFRK